MHSFGINFQFYHAIELPNEHLYYASTGKKKKTHLPHATGQRKRLMLLYFDIIV